MSSTGFIKPGNALFIVFAIGLAASVVVGAEGDEDALLRAGDGAAADLARRSAALPVDRDQAPAQRAANYRDSAGAFTLDEELVDSAAGDTPRGDEIEPTFDSSVPHKIDPEAEAKDKARAVAVDGSIVAQPLNPARTPDNFVPGE